MREHIDLVEASTRPSKLETTPLPYGEKDLAPVLSADSINYHYGHLAKGYAKRYNAGEGNADFNRAGSFLHNKFCNLLGQTCSRRTPVPMVWLHPKAIPAGC